MFKCSNFLLFYKKDIFDLKNCKETSKKLNFSE